MTKEEIIERLKYLNDNIDTFSERPSSSNDLNQAEIKLYLYGYSEKDREELFKVIDDFDSNFQLRRNDSYKEEKINLEIKLKKVL